MAEAEGQKQEGEKKDGQVEEGTETSEEPEEIDKGSRVFSPEGLIMLSFGVLLDSLSIFCVSLIVFFGVGLVLAKIVYFVGLFLVSAWVLIRSQNMAETASIKGKTKKAGKNLIDFFKRRWKKLGAKFIPAIGDALPLWTWTIYSELKN